MSSTETSKKLFFVVKAKISLPLDVINDSFIFTLSQIDEYNHVDDMMSAKEMVKKLMLQLFPTIN